MRAVSTAGEHVVVDCPLPWLMRLLTDGAGGELSEGNVAEGGESVRLEIERSRAPFPHSGWPLIARGAWASGSAVVMADACSSGFDLRIEPLSEVLCVAARYRPSLRTRAANVLLRRRFRLLAVQTLLHYPALWWASAHGRVPLHVSVTANTDMTTMIAGPGGVGKSTLLLAGLERGDVATADNICACDASQAHGLAEPLRVASRSGRSTTTHGRTEQPLPSRVDCLRPDRLVVLRRAAEPGVESISPAAAARALIAGTYMAGELRRFWSFAATLALGTGIGPAHPDVAGVATALATRLPGFSVSVMPGSALPAGDALHPAGTR
jgi:hypothetical protein